VKERKRKEVRRKGKEIEGEKKTIPLGPSVERVREPINSTFFPLCDANKAGNKTK
jgi:hypothetical protein